MHVQDLLQVDARLLRLHEFCERIDRRDRLLELRQLLLAHQVDLVHQYLVGKRDLRDGLVDLVVFALLLDVFLDVLAIDEADDAVDAEVVGDDRVLRERRDDGRWVGEACGLDQHEVKVLLAVLELRERLHQVAAHRAARAAVVERDHLLRHLEVLLDERLVDAHGAKLILDHADFHAVIRAVEDVVDERGLACTEEAGQHRHG
mmetsp:Transcript_9869/g.26259  ORF Transcript_9869/g.26259 Transcript_9869/m.26259 type:complete len:204 (-) Transcript_9869:277-888(-)